VDHIESAAANLRRAVHELCFDGSKRPASMELGSAWPELGRGWIAEWVTELERDAATVSDDLRAAREGANEDEALVPLENAAWRLGAARTKLHAIVALFFGVPSIRIGEDKNQTISFRPSMVETRAKLRELRSASDAAKRLIDADGQLKAALLLRHQVAHSLAPLIKAHSLVLYEAALIERGGVTHYLSLHLPPKGLERMDNLGRSLAP
jgi:hypothetical protein